MYNTFKEVLNKNEKLSVAIVGCGNSLINEALGVRRIIGIMLLILSVYIMSNYNSKINGWLSLKEFFIWLAGGLSSGLADFCQKIYALKIGESAEIMSSGLYINSTAKTFAAQILPSAQIYPVLQGENLIFSAIFARILFKEKMTPTGVLGLTAAFICNYYFKWIHILNFKNF